MMDYGDRHYSIPLTRDDLADLVLITMHRGGYTNPYAIDTNKLWDKISTLPDGRSVGPRSSVYIQMRNVLNGLVGAGLIGKPFAGRKSVASKWTLMASEWDRYSPFTPSNGHPPRTPTPAHAGDDDDGDDTVPSAAYNAVVTKNQELVKQVQSCEELIQAAMDHTNRQKAEIDLLNEKLSDASRQCRTIKIVKPDGKSKEMKDVILPKYFDDLLALCALRKPVLLVGPAGAGKTHAAELAAQVLDLKFEAVSCTAGMSEAHLTGRIRPKLTGDDLFQTTGFLECYENGGVFLFDEFDAADPNLLLVVNTALANGYCNVPNRETKTRAKRHPDFVAIATANTFGRGATRMYSGRNQLDEATLDRFRIGMIEVDYDRLLEESLCPDDELRTWCWKVRDGIEKAQLRRVMSTRFMRDAYDMKTVAGWEMDKIRKVYFNGWGIDEVNKVISKF